MKKGEQYTFQAKGYGLDTAKITWTTSKKAIVVIDKKSGITTAKNNRHRLCYRKGIKISRLK